MKNKLIHGDCFEILPTLPDNSVDTVITDPPYFRIRNHDWDNQWNNLETYLDWIESVSLEIKRVLKNNGSFYIFGDDKVIAYIQVRLDKHFTLLNNLVWYKRNNRPIKNAYNFRSYAPVTERILFYGLEDKTGLNTIKHDINNFKNLRQYAQTIRNYIDYSRKKTTEILGNGRCQHFLEPLGPQWNLCTEKTYQDLIDIFHVNEMEGFREYKELRLEYEELRLEYEETRRYFNHKPNVYEVIDIPIISVSENTTHPTTKPLKLIKTLVEISVRHENIVLDPFGGSGTTALACLELGRKYIVIEKDEEYYRLTKERIENWHNKAKDSNPSYDLPDGIERDLKEGNGQLKLF